MNLIARGNRFVAVDVDVESVIVTSRETRNRESSKTNEKNAEAGARHRLSLLSGK
jgi:hypothetical protein